MTSAVTISMGIESTIRENTPTKALKNYCCEKGTMLTNCGRPYTLGKVLKCKYTLKVKPVYWERVLKPEIFRIVNMHHCQIKETANHAFLITEELL